MNYSETAFLSPTTLKLPSRHLAPSLSQRTPVNCTASDEPQRRRRRRPEKKASAFENTIEDLTMKRMGRGTIYYGERASDTNIPEEEMLPEDELLKPNPVLVTGSTGRTGQWITLGLLNQDFNVRSLSRSFDKVEKLFGPSGSNVDVFEGDLCNFDQVYEAVDGAVSVVCASTAAWWWPGGFDSVDVKGVQNLVDAALKSATVERFVLISSMDKASARGKAKERAESIVIESGIPYVILRAADLNDREAGVKQILLSPTGSDSPKSALGVSRVDLAQSVCQSLVYNRSISQLQAENEDSVFDFPSCIVNVQNGVDPHIPDTRFWKREFNSISDAYRDNTDIPEDTEP